MVSGEDREKYQKESRAVRSDPLKGMTEESAIEHHMKVMDSSVSLTFIWETCILKFRSCIWIYQFLPLHSILLITSKCIVFKINFQLFLTLIHLSKTSDIQRGHCSQNNCDDQLFLKGVMPLGNINSMKKMHGKRSHTYNSCQIFMKFISKVYISYVLDGLYNQCWPIIFKGVIAPWKCKFYWKLHCKCSHPQKCTFYVPVRCISNIKKIFQTCKIPRPNKKWRPEKWGRPGTPVSSLSFRTCLPWDSV